MCEAEKGSGGKRENTTGKTGGWKKGVPVFDKGDLPQGVEQAIPRLVESAIGSLNKSDCGQQG
jgi:hypothetical protein